MSNLVGQYVAVALAIGIAIGWIVRRILRRRRSRRDGCQSSSSAACPGCPLSDRCTSRK